MDVPYLKMYMDTPLTSHDNFEDRLLHAIDQIHEPYMQASTFMRMADDANLPIEQRIEFYNKHILDRQVLHMNTMSVRNTGVVRKTDISRMSCRQQFAVCTHSDHIM